MVCKIRIKGYWRRKPKRRRVNGRGVKKALRYAEGTSRRSFGLKKRRR